MRNKFILILFIFSSTVFGQKKKQKHRFGLYNPGVDVYSGYRLPSANFYKQLNSLNSFSFNRPLFIMGVGISEHLTKGGTTDFTRQLSYSQITQQSITIEDSVNCKISGFIFSLRGGANLIFKSKVFRLYFGLGINAGRLKLYEKDLLNKTCPIITPKISLSPTVFIQRFYVSLSIEYDYDFFNSGWTNHTIQDAPEFNFIKLRQSGFMTLFRLGFLLNKQ